MKSYKYGVTVNRNHQEVKRIKVKSESLFCLTTPLEHIDFYLIIGYWTSFIWSR